MKLGIIRRTLCEDKLTCRIEREKKSFSSSRSRSSHSEKKEKEKIPKKSRFVDVKCIVTDFAASINTRKQL